MFVLEVKVQHTINNNIIYFLTAHVENPNHPHTSSCTYDYKKFPYLTTIQDIKKLREAILEPIGSWQMLCESLGVKEGIIDEIRYSVEQPVIKKSNCLAAYYKNGEATWEEVILAVARYPLNNLNLAKKLAHDHLEDGNLEIILEILQSCKK